MRISDGCLSTKNIVNRKHVLDDSRNVQVIMIDGNFTVLTFCEKSQLMSFILSREKEVNMSEVRISYELVRNDLFLSCF